MPVSPTQTTLITGATDGIGLETARSLARFGGTLLLHGRDEMKLARIAEELSQRHPDLVVSCYIADLSRRNEVSALAREVAAQHDHIDTLINNAGVFRTAHPITPSGLDVRFAVNTLAPLLLTRALLSLLNVRSRVINLSSAAQASVNLNALRGHERLDDGAAYAQSKLALTMWSVHMAAQLGEEGPLIIAVNPGSYLATKMVREGFGMRGNDVGIGADILTRAARSEEFAHASGRYFDNDSRRFASPHPDAQDARKIQTLMCVLDHMLTQR